MAGGIPMKYANRELPWLIAAAAAALLVATWSTRAQAYDKPERRGGQVEGIIGANACLPGRAPCSSDGLVFDGVTRPSFGVGAGLGFRPVRWFMIGALYRYGMNNPDYRVQDGPSYRSAGQHTFAVTFRPILPIWRFDLGLNIAPGFGRQVFRINDGGDRDISQGFSFLTGPTFDFFITRRFFLGAEVDFIFNTQRKVCERRGSDTNCTRSPDRRVAPTHQVLFGLRIGGTFG